MVAKSHNTSTLFRLVSMHLVELQVLDPPVREALLHRKMTLIHYTLPNDRTLQHLID
jgi:hypothetical protein